MFSKHLSVFITISLCYALGSCNTCETPTEWLTSSPHEHGYGMRGQKWPNGVVKYKFDESLSSADVIRVNQAFDEYHLKTCVRFESAHDGDLDYVSIEADDGVCGQAHVCKRGGYQFAKFGGQCRNMATIIHQLGHSLCLSHEHQRKDRDQYINFSRCLIKPETVENFEYNKKGIYDYASQMHAPCQSCTGGWPEDQHVKKCGSDYINGLSFLDADTINALYDCQGCNRHRWRPTADLTEEDWSNMYSFGYDSPNGKPMFVCRAFSNGELAPGVYDVANKTCKISYYWKAHAVESGVELLTIPGGPYAQCSPYKLVESSELKYRGAVRNAVKVGTSLQNKNFEFHIAYGMRQKAVGKAIWVANHMSYKDGEAEVIDGLWKCYTTKGFKILTCDIDLACIQDENSPRII